MKNEAKKKKNIIPYIALGWILLIAVGVVYKRFQNDTFYTIKIGELILKNGIDMMDHFSMHILPYTYPHWLYDVFIYVVYKLGGFTGIYISSIVLFIILLFSLFKVTYKLTNSYVSALFATILCLIAVRTNVTARAQLVSYILFILEVYSVDMFVETNKKKYAVYLLIISLLICNMHVAVWPFFFILFLPFVGESIVSKIMIKMKHNDPTVKFIKRKLVISNDIKLKPLIILMLLCLLTGLLTPIKDTPYTYLIKTMMGNSQKYILEHQSIPFFTNIFTIMIIIETFFWGFYNKIKLRDFFLLSGLSVMACMALRHIGLLGLLGSLCLGRTVSLFLNDYVPTADDKFFTFLKKKLVVIPCFLISIGIFYFTFKSNVTSEFVIKEAFPVSMSKYIKKNLDFKNIRLYNEYNFGSYLLYQDIPVFIDSRADLYTKQFSGLDYDIFDDYEEMMKDYKELFDFYNFTHAIVYNNTNMDRNLAKDENFKVLESDDYFTLYERINDKNE